MLLIYLIIYIFQGEIFTKSTALFDYESQSSYTLEVTASDGTLEDVQNLIVQIDDVNEKPSVIVVTRLGDILESEIVPRMVLNMAASDPDNDVLTYNILGSNPSGAPFIIDSTNGKCVCIDKCS